MTKLGMGMGDRLQVDGLAALLFNSRCRNIIVTDSAHDGLVSPLV